MTRTPTAKQSYTTAQRQDKRETNERRRSQRVQAPIMKCRCNQEEKAVVLVGCTQNGKSSLIRTILRYGGYMKEAAAVEIGIGNKSTTKYVSSHKVAINIRRHEVNDEEGNAVPFVDEDTDIYDLVPESYQSGRHVHLLL